MCSCCIIRLFLYFFLPADKLFLSLGQLTSLLFLNYLLPPSRWLFISPRSSLTHFLIIFSCDILSWGKILYLFLLSYSTTLNIAFLVIFSPCPFSYLLISPSSCFISTFVYCSLSVCLILPTTMFSTSCNTFCKK